MGAEIAALTGFFSLSGAFALVGTAFAGWMAWRIVEKSGLPGWAGLGAILLTLTGIGSIVPLVLLWVFAFMRWPRDTAAAAGPYAVLQATPGAAPGATQVAAPAALPAPAAALPDRRAWRLNGTLPSGAAVALSIDGSVNAYVVTGAPSTTTTELSVPDASIGQPHARLLIAAGRIGLEDLGTPGGTLIDGARLLPEHGPRDISAARTIRVGVVELALSRG